MTCQNVDFGRLGFDLIACGCSSNASSERFSAKSNVKTVRRSFRKILGAGKLLCFRSDSAKRHVYSTKTSEGLVTGKDNFFYQSLNIVH